MKVFVTGACGYKGSVLVPKLLAKGHEVVAFDIQWFGNHLQPHPALTVVQGDVRDPDQVDLDGVDAVIHLSSIANDPCGDLDPKLTWEVSCLATMRLADRCLRKGIRRFLFASSGAAAGALAVPGLAEAAQDATLDFSQSGLVTGKLKPLKHTAIPGFLSAQQIAPHRAAHYGGALKAATSADARLEEAIKSGMAVDAAAIGQLKRLINSRGNSVVLHEMCFDGLAPGDVAPAADVRRAVENRPQVRRPRETLSAATGRGLECCLHRSAWSLPNQDPSKRAAGVHRPSAALGALAQSAKEVVRGSRTDLRGRQTRHHRFRRPAARRRLCGPQPRAIADTSQRRVPTVPQRAN